MSFDTARKRKHIYKTYATWSKNLHIQASNLILALLVRLQKFFGLQKFFATNQLLL